MGDTGAIDRLSRGPEVLLGRVSMAPSGAEA